MSDYVIREVRSSDFESLVDTYYSFFDEVNLDPSFGLILQDEKPSIAEEMKWFSGLLLEIEKGNAIAFVAVVGSRVIGSCDVRRVRPGSSLAHRGELGIFVRDVYRGKGIGEALLRKVLESCKGKFEIVELVVFSNNDPAKILYRKLGFETTGLKKRAVKRAGQYFDEDLMVLYID